MVKGSAEPTCLGSDAFNRFGDTCHGKLLPRVQSLVWPIQSMASITGFSLLRVSVRGIAEAPDELLDERQRSVRNSNYRYSYLILGYIVVGFMALLAVGPDVRPFGENPGDAGFIYIALLMTMASLPSMVLAWREKDI
jgi:hypothetical protein